MTDPQRFESFMRSYQNMVYTTAYRLLANHAESQDVSQEVFLRAYDRFDEIGDSPQVGGWLKTVTRNLCLNHLTRHRKRWRHFSDIRREGYSDDSDYGAQLADDNAATGGSDDSKDQRLLLENALNDLPDDQRISIALYHFEDLPYQDIAKRLKVSLSKVKTDILRGRRTLRQKLELKRGDLGI